MTNPIDDAPENAAAPMSPTRPMYWSVQRELWENMFLYAAPAVVTGFVMFGTLIAITRLPHRIHAIAGNDPGRLHTLIATPFSMAPAPIMLTTFIVGIFYALDALYGERRDRSILFWKSLPVSDVRTVLSKASIPLVVMPILALILSLLTVSIMLLVGTVVFVGNGMNPLTLWSEYRFVQEPLIMAYGLTVHSLWFAPIYCWLLLVSAWSKRAPLIWAVLPFLAVSAVEKLAFNTMYFMRMLEYRVMGAMKEAFSFKVTEHGRILDQLADLDPLKFLTRPGLWLGLAFAAIFIAAAVRLRRYREPI